MRIRTGPVVGFVFLCLMISACSPPATGTPTETAAATEVVAAPSPTEAPTAAPQADSCLDCHTDKDRLIETAKEEEKVASESSGVG